MSLSKVPVSPIKTNDQFQLQHDINTPGAISFEGLPQGSTVAQVVRCIQLLQHIPGCRGAGECEEGEGCRRTKQILTHHFSCSGRSGCSVCNQLLALCRHHSQRCQASKGTCTVLYCKNKNLGMVSQLNKFQPNHSTEKQARSEHVLKLKRQLSEMLGLLRDTRKLQELGRLTETNEKAALQLLLFYGRKHKSCQSASCEMRKEAIRNEIGLTKDKLSQRAINSRIVSPSTCRLKLDVLVRAHRLGTQLTDIKS